MEGSVRYADGRVLITAQLIDPDSDVPLWTDSFKREFADIIAIQSDIARIIANALEAEVSVAEQASLGEIPTDLAPAYGLYLKAITAIGDAGTIQDPALHDQFHRDMDQAIAADPSFALAHAYKALAYATSVGGVLRIEDESTRAERARLAREHANQALDLDENVGVAHSALARLYEFSQRLPEATQAYERAYALSPNDLNVLIDYPLFMSYSDRIETALQIARPLVELSPGWGHVMVTIILMLDNDFEAALMMAREGILFIPSHTLARAYFGILEAINGNVELALENLRIAERLSQSSFTAPTVLVALAEGYGIIGQHDDARRILVRIQAMGERYTVGAACLGLAYLATGDEDNALEWLRQAADDKRPDEAVLAQSFVRANIYADPVLERPEFIAVRERLGFESL